MSKQGMKRPEISDKEQCNQAPPVPEIQGKAKHGKEPAASIIAGTASPSMKVYHAVPHKQKHGAGMYPSMYSDLAIDNLENDIPEADLQP